MNKKNYGVLCSYGVLALIMAAVVAVFFTICVYAASEETAANATESTTESSAVETAATETLTTDIPTTESSVVVTSATETSVIESVTTTVIMETESTEETTTVADSGPTAKPTPPGPTSNEAETAPPPTETTTEETATERETEEETTTEERKPGDGVPEETAPAGPTEEETTAPVGPTTEKPETGGPTEEKPPVDNRPELDNEYGVIQNNIDRMLDKLGVGEGKTVYFTFNQKACSSWRKNGHGCSNCNNANIVKAAWFKEAFGEVNTELFPPHSASGGTAYNIGSSCFGFACFAQWYVLADSSDEKLNAECVAVIGFNKDEIMKNVKPGDVLRVNNSHSMLVYSVDESGIVVVDSNWNIGNQLNCVVQKHMILYDSVYRGDLTRVYRAVKVYTPVMEWLQADGNWYYMDYKTGVRTKGWMQSPDSGLWYYFEQEDGVMLYDCWLCDPDTNMWYYLDPNGAMCTSWIVVDNMWYYLDMNGAMCTGWNIINDKWYLFHISGNMLTGWQEVGEKLYYMTENGDCLMNTTTPDGYRVDENGARIE